MKCVAFVLASGVTDVANDIYLLFNAAIGPAIAAIYFVAMWKQKIYRRNLIGDHSETTFANQAKVTKTLTILVSIYSILVAFPLTTLFFAIFFRPFSVQITYGIVSPVAYLGMSLNSSINVIVYVHSSSNLRPYIKQLLKCA